MSPKNIRMLVTAAAASLLLIGCGSEESAPEAQEPAERPMPANPSGPIPRNKIVERSDPDGKAMHLTATDPEGKQFTASIGERVEIPEAFPKDIPIFPGSTPMAFLYAPGEGIIVTFKSGEEQQAIFDFYESSLSGDGWDILENAVDSGKLSFEAVKDARKVTVTVAGTEGDARVSVIVTPES